MTAPATSLKNELMKLENEFRDAMVSGDSQTLERLSADPCLVVGSQGARAMKRNEVGAMSASSDFQLKSYKVDDSTVAVRELGPGIATLAYRVEDRYEANGKPQSAKAFDCSTWIKKGSSRECAVHTESLIEPPK